jgi:rubrerythrin
MADDDDAREAGLDEGGDPACWLSRVCPACGRLADADLADSCPACGVDLADR